MAKQTQTTGSNPLSFVDTYGATVTIPAGEAANYAGCKAQHLRVITQLLAAGSDIDISQSVTRDLSVIANALAFEMESLIDIVANDAAIGAKGAA